MNTRLQFSPSRTIVILTLMVLSACHGEGDHAVEVLPTTASLTVGVPIRDTVFIGGFNTYSVSAIPGALYKISITRPTDDVDLLFFGSDSTFSVLASCAVDNTSLIGVIERRLHRRGALQHLIPRR